jgi:hypothetical protein
MRHANAKLDAFYTVTSQLERHWPRPWPLAAAERSKALEDTSGHMRAVYASCSSVVYMRRTI